MDAALADGGVLFAVNRLSPLDRARVEPSIRCGAGVSEPVTLRKAVLTIQTSHPGRTVYWRVIQASLRCGGHAIPHLPTHTALELRTTVCSANLPFFIAVCRW